VARGAQHASTPSDCGISPRSSSLINRPYDSSHHNQKPVSRTRSDGRIVCAEVTRGAGTVPPHRSDYDFVMRCWTVAELQLALAFTSFARVLRDRGVLVLAVREWDASASRKLREPLFRKRVDTPRGRLTFTSMTPVDSANRRLNVKEQHLLEVDGRVRDRRNPWELAVRSANRDCHQVESHVAVSARRDIHDDPSLWHDSPIRARQVSMWVTPNDLPRSAAHRLHTV
jgi:hypothetical protein